MGIEPDTIYLDDFLIDGIIKENQFREKVNSIDWGIYKDKKVMIKGCTSALFLHGHI